MASSGGGVEEAKKQDEFITFSVHEAGLAQRMYFKLRRSQRLGVMFREYARRRELALKRTTAYSFRLDGEAIRSDETARTLHLGEEDVIVASEDDEGSSKSTPPEDEGDDLVDLAAVKFLEKLERGERPEEDVAALGTTASRFRRGVGPAACSVVVRGLAETTTRRDVLEAARVYGAVEACVRIGPGSRLVRWSTAEAANRASVNANGLALALLDDTQADGDISVEHAVVYLPPFAASTRHARRENDDSDADDRSDDDQSRRSEDDDLGSRPAPSSQPQSPKKHPPQKNNGDDDNGGGDDDDDERDSFEEEDEAGEGEDGCQLSTDAFGLSAAPEKLAPSSGASARTEARPFKSFSSPTTEGQTSGGLTTGSTTTTKNAVCERQTRASTCVCRWIVDDVDARKKRQAARAHKGEYHERGFRDAAGHEWLLYYFVDGDGVDNAGHVSLYLSVRDPHLLPFGWQKHATFVVTLESFGDHKGRAYSKWATQVFRAAPPPAVQDWGWPKFASHAELEHRHLISPPDARGRRRLRVRAVVAVTRAAAEISAADADACLLAAARSGSPKSVKRCLDAGADAKTCRDRGASGSGRTPLHLACARGHRPEADSAAAAMVPLLADAGADLDAEDAHGETALHLAVAKGAMKAASALLEAGADPARPVRGAVPREDALTLAAGAGRSELAVSLLNAGAPPTGQAVLLAAKKGHLDVLWPLLDAARDDDRLSQVVAARNAKGDTAVALLVARGLVDAAATMVASYRAPLADCSRDRRAARHARLRILLKQRENDKKLHQAEASSSSAGDDKAPGGVKNKNLGPEKAEKNDHGCPENDDDDVDEEKRARLVLELEAEEAEREAKTLKAREKKRAKRLKQRNKRKNKSPDPKEEEGTAVAPDGDDDRSDDDERHPRIEHPTKAPNGGGGLGDDAPSPDRAPSDDDRFDDEKATLSGTVPLDAGLDGVSSKDEPASPDDDRDDDDERETTSPDEPAPPPTEAGRGSPSEEHATPPGCLGQDADVVLGEPTPTDVLPELDVEPRATKAPESLDDDDEPSLLGGRLKPTGGEQASPWRAVGRSSTMTASAEARVVPPPSQQPPNGVEAGANEIARRLSNLLASPSSDDLLGGFALPPPASVHRSQSTPLSHDLVSSPFAFGSSLYSNAAAAAPGRGSGIGPSIGSGPPAPNAGSLF